MTLQGKGFFIWKVRGCENGDPATIATLAQEGNYSHVLVKIADGTYSYNIETGGRDLVIPVVQALHARGIQVYGWHYVYGDDPIGEANKAIQRIQQTRVDGYVLDVEKEYKEPGKKAAAVTFMNRLRSAFPNLPMGLSSYRFPSYHPQVPWKEFLEYCNFNSPQVYWQGAHNPADQVRRTVSEFQAITPYRPLIPTGSAYKTLSWAATPEDVVHFLQACQSLNLSAANFWECAHCRKYLPEVWQAIQGYSWPSTLQSVDIALQYIAALNTHNPEQVVGLYSPSAVHVNAARTVQGIEALRAWYGVLLSQLLPNAAFILTGYSGSGGSRHLTWTATSASGNVQDGSDTLALTDGKIAYHYTYFTIQPKG